MTYQALLKRLQRMPPLQLRQKILLCEGCSGNWTSVTAIYTARKNMYQDGEEPGTERHKELSEFGPVKPVARKGESYLLHDH